MSEQKKPTILIAEDNPQTMELMKKFFVKANGRKDLSCEVIEAVDGGEAIQMLDIAQPDIILCDIGMPVKNGFDVLQHFTSTSRDQNQYCFFCFLSASKDEKIRAFENGADGFLSKLEINYFVFTLQIRSWLRLVELERKFANETPAS